MKTDHIIDFNTREYQQVLKNLRSENPGYGLYIIAGINSSQRKTAIDEFKRELLGDFEELSLTGVITPYEDESYENIDSMIQNISDEPSLIIFRNAEELCGVYTAFSSSTVRYATPQEKYFLKEIQNLNRPVILELKNKDYLDRTMVRFADAVVMCNEPTSFFDRIAFKLSQISLNGSNLPSARPLL